MPKWKIVAGGLFVCSVIVLVMLINISGYLNIRFDQSRKLETLGKIHWQYEQVVYCIGLHDQLVGKLKEAVETKERGNLESGEILKLETAYLILLTTINTLAEDPSMAESWQASLMDYSGRLTSYYRYYSTLLDPEVYQTAKGANTVSTPQGIEPAWKRILEGLRQEVAAEISNNKSSMEVRLESQALMSTISTGFCLVLSMALVVFTLVVGRRKERTLSLALESSEKAVNAHSNLIEHASYQIRTPMSTITSTVELLRSTELTDYQAESLEVMESSMEAINVTLRDVLDSTVIENRKLSLDPELISLNEFLDSLYRCIKPLATSNDLALSFEWTRSENLGIGVDPLRLRQVLHNLLSYAIYYNDQGYVSLSVHSGESRDGTIDLTFAVTASGIGISEDQLTLLIEAFSKPMDSLPGRPLYMDLGLYISMAIVHSMEGVISMDSQYGKGITISFSVNVPLLSQMRVRRPGQAMEQETATPGERAPVKGLSSVLVVDDIPVNRLMAQRILKEMGLTSDTASNGKEALEAVQRKPYDLILMDLKMPELDGYEATQLIRALDLDPQPVIIALTAQVLTSSKERSIEVGMDAFIGKPFRMEEFHSTLARFFDLNYIGRRVIRLRKD